MTAPTVTARDRIRTTADRHGWERLNVSTDGADYFRRDGVTVTVAYRRGFPRYGVRAAIESLTRYHVTYSARYQNWTVVDSDGVQAFTDGRPLVFTTERDASEYIRP